MKIQVQIHIPAPDQALPPEKADDATNQENIKKMSNSKPETLNERDKKKVWKSHDIC